MRISYNLFVQKDLRVYAKLVTANLSDRKLPAVENFYEQAKADSTPKAKSSREQIHLL